MFFETLLASSESSNWGPADDRWYEPIGGAIVTPAGLRVDAEGAQKLSAWYRGRLILATVLAMLPLQVYRKLPADGGSELATDHPLYDVLHDQPNSWQDSFQWRLDKMFNLIDSGWTYDRFAAGARGFAHELHPIPPRLVTPEQIKRGPQKGRYLFHVRDDVTGQTTTETQDDIFYIRGPEGKGILERARMSIGTALATEDYSARVFGRGAMNGGVIEVPGVLNDDAGQRMAESFLTRPGDWHVPKVLEQGAKWNKPEMTPEDFEMILSRKFSIDDMARWLGVPRHMLENSDPSFGNAEQFDESFMTYSMGGWLAMFEFAIKSQLILPAERGRIYAEFTRDAIARGKLIDRWNVHVASVNAGIKTVDEARAKEGLNKRGGKADELRQPQNIVGKPIPDSNQLPGRPSRRQPATDDKAQDFARANAARVLQLEITAIQRLGVKFSADAARFATEVNAFYKSHVGRVCDAMLMTLPVAEEYCFNQARQIRDDGVKVSLDKWTSDDYARGLAAWALEEVA